MKLRIRWSGGRATVALPEEGATLTYGALVAAVSKRCSLDIGSFSLSLNGHDALQLDDHDIVEGSHAGIRSGDLLIMIEHGAKQRTMPRADADEGTVKTVAGCVAAEQPSKRLSTSLVDQAQPAAVMPLAVATSGHVAADFGGAAGATTASICQVMQDTENMEEWKHQDVGHVATPEAAHIPDRDTANRYLREPMLVREASRDCLPQPLAAALQAVLCDPAGWTSADVLFAVLHVLMVESGYRTPASSELLESAGAPLPSFWKTPAGYAVSYTHPALGDAATFTVTGMTLGPRVLVVRAIAGQQCLAVMQLSVSDYVSSPSPGMHDLNVCKELARLSRTFKDAFSHRLLGELERWLGLPEYLCLPYLVRLPLEMQLHLFSFLDPLSLIRVGSTCSALQRICCLPRLWRRHHILNYGVPRGVSHVGFDWYSGYRQRWMEEKRKRAAALAAIRHRPYPPMPLLPPYLPPWQPLPPCFEPEPLFPGASGIPVPHPIDRRILQYFRPYQHF